MILKPDDVRQMFFTSRADMVAGEELVHTIDEVVNRLDLVSLYACWSEGGRGFFDPSMMLKVLFFAYCDGEHHSRDIAKKIKYDIRYQYFAGSLRPAHNTICRFRNIDVDLLASYFVQIVSVCNEMGFLDNSFLAIDGTKIKASASGKRTLRRKDLNSLKEKYKELLSADAASEIEDVGDDDIDGDVSESTVEPVNGRDLKARIGRAIERLEAGASEVNLTDSDARFMKTSDGGIRPSYNGQIAVDKNQIIVAVDISNNADDSPGFQSMVDQSRDNMDNEIGKVLVDGGYYSGSNLKYIDRCGLDVYMPTGRADPGLAGRFGRADFIYDKETDSYLCPAGEYLNYKGNRKRNGVTIRIYGCSSRVCSQCSMLSGCTTHKRKRRELWISEVYRHERAMKKKLSSVKGRAIYDRRKVMVEPVFGNIKYNLGFRQFVLRGLKKVKAEFLLMCIAHNLKKMSRHWTPLKPSRRQKTVLNKRIFSCLSLFFVVLRKLVICYKNPNPSFKYAL